MIQMYFLGIWDNLGQKYSKISITISIFIFIWKKDLLLLIQINCVFYCMVMALC
jgi:hypothetical protein